MSIKDDFNQKRQDEYDCCGCSKPWVLFDELLERAEAAEAKLAAAEALAAEVDGWTPYETRDIGEAFPADSIRDLITEVRAALA